MNEYVSLTQQELSLINGFLDKYEKFLENEGFNFSTKKEKRNRMRERIFQEIELSVEKTGGYNLQKIIEKQRPKPTIELAEDERILEIPLLSVLKMFGWKPQTRMRKSKHEVVQLVQSQVEETEEAANEIIHSVVTEQGINRGEKVIKYDLNVVQAKDYAKAKSNRIKRTLKMIHWISFGIFIISIFAYVYYRFDAVFNNNLDCTTYYYDYSHPWHGSYNICTYYGIDTDNLQAAILFIIASYVSILSMYVIARIILWNHIKKLEKVIAILKLKSQFEIMEEEIEDYSEIFYKLLLLEIITIEGGNNE
ncbi:MAG: hypothetical protein INQ03_11445 [Candidatus Heimdallarchaeota archaeon]|nr:hypothetical protein [Candidatus Heimdallarchaeota archaeon]